jgi:hypothetical protein
MRKSSASLPPGANILVGREGRRALVAGVLVMTIVGLAAFAGSRSFTWSIVPAPTQVPSEPGDQEIYTGSIVFVPENGDACWQRFLDNRTGRSWDQGVVSCDNQDLFITSGPASSRFETVRKVFSRQ